MPSLSTGSPPRALSPVREAHSRAHRGAAHPTRTRRLQERTSRLGRSLLPQRSAEHPRGPRPALNAPPGMRQRPRSPRRARTGVYRVWGLWSGPRPKALRGLSHLPRAYINAAARVPAALPQVTLWPWAAGVWLWALRRARRAPRPRPGAPRRRLSLSHLSFKPLPQASAPAAPPPLLAPPQPPQPRALAGEWSQRPTQTRTCARPRLLP